MAGSGHTFRVLAFLLMLPPAALPARGYTPGETLHYKIKWGLVTAGHARMEVRAERLPNGREVHRFTSTARGTPFIERFFPVRNRITSLFDPVRRRTLFNSKQLREGSYRRSYEVVFDHSAHRATWKQREFSGNDNPDAVWKERAGVTGDLPAQFQDMLTAIYYSRSYGAGADAAGEPGTAFTMPVYDDLKLGRLKMEILGRETLGLEINGQEREIAALRVRPLIKTSGLFRSRGETLLYISDDEQRIILRVDAVVHRAGKVRLLLHRTEGVAGLR